MVTDASAPPIGFIFNVRYTASIVIANVLGQSVDIFLLGMLDT